MAIVFISPKGKQRLFFAGMTMLLIGVLTAAGLFILAPDFFGKSQYAPAKEGSNKPNPSLNALNLKLDFSIMDSQKVTSLTLFDQIETRFVYTVKNQQGKQVTGNISAISQEDARKFLQEAGFEVVSLQEVTIGRSNPFIAY